MKFPPFDKTIIIALLLKGRISNRLSDLCNKHLTILFNPKTIIEVCNLVSRWFL